MLLIRKKQIPDNALNSVVAIGNFDGVHQGHQSVIGFARDLAKKKNKSLSVLTFEPHPKCYFKNRKSGFRITPFRIKFELIKEQKVDFYINMKFDSEFLKISCHEFIDKILVDKLKAYHVVTGFDFVFGHRQEGNVELLKKKSFETKRFECSVVKEYKNKNIKEISSSAVRTLLKESNLIKVREILGRSWSVKARVIKGEKLGRKIGFPTANLIIKKFCEFSFGVYEVKVFFKKDFCNYAFKGIANYGIKPTFSSNEPILEVHIFDFNKNIYGEFIEIVFEKFIRKEKKFDNLSCLKAQIESDIKSVKDSKNI